MLDIEVIVQPTKTGIDVVSVDEFARHLRLSPSLRSNATWIANMTDAINEAVGQLHGFTGELNRMILPCTLKRYLTRFPKAGDPIFLPYPDVISLDAITIEDGASPANIVPPSSYSLKRSLVPEVYALTTWPTVVARPRAISITYQAGYADLSKQTQLKRMVKILAAHYLENPEATINEPRQTVFNRRIEFGMDSARAALRVPVSYDDWGEA